MTPADITLPPNPSAADVLRAVRLILGDPKRWCGGAYARDAKGVELDKDASGAVRWCVMGAVHRASGGADPTPYYDALSRAYRVGRSSNPFGANEWLFTNNDHAGLLAWLDRAIEFAEKEDGGDDAE